jgi:Tfp pilus assembly protein PilN
LTEVKGKILARVDAIEKLDHRRNFYINMLEDLDSRIPEYLWMTGFTETPGGPPPGASNEPARSTPGNTATAAPKDSVPANPGIGTASVEGYAFSLNAIGTFIISMMKSDFFHNVRLDRAKAEDIGNVTAYSFKLTCQINYDAHMATDEYENTDEGPHISSTHGHNNQDIDRNDPDNLFEQR